MGKALGQIGQFLRILDETNQISLTNLTVYIAMYKLLTSTTPNYTDIAALIASLGTYTVKKVLNG